ncbi:MAG: AraC family transcriptional regulator [Lachnospiraceae bacterium]|nr:AraC family transcriptional regulator [Lachnospiraceae bacterium]
MNQEIIDRLSPITDEEKSILGGHSEIEKSIYTGERGFIIDSHKMLDEGNLIQIRTHTRFIPFPKHTHNYVEMVYMVSGHTDHIVDGIPVRLEAGEILLMNQHAAQEILAADKNDIALNFIILPEFFDQTLRMMVLTQSPLRDFLVNCLKSERSQTSFLHFKVSDILPIQNLMENLIYSLLSGEEDFYKDEMTMGLLFLHLLSHTKNVVAGGSSYDQELVFDVLSYIATYYKDASLSNFARARHLDLTRISKIIKKHTGFNYQQLLQQQRIAKACELLTNTTLSIEEISQNVGYDNISFFHRLFKKYYGMSPRHYRLKTAEKG